MIVVSTVNSVYTRTCLFIVDGIHFTSDGGMVCIVIVNGIHSGWCYA